MSNQPQPEVNLKYFTRSYIWRADRLELTCSFAWICQPVGPTPLLPGSWKQRFRGTVKLKTAGPPIEPYHAVLCQKMALELYSFLISCKSTFILIWETTYFKNTRCTIAEHGKFPIRKLVPGLCRVSDQQFHLSSSNKCLVGPKLMITNWSLSGPRIWWGPIPPPIGYHILLKWGGGGGGT